MLIISSIVAVIVFAFFIWHYLLSIYEVKFYFNFPGKNLKSNSKYFISCTGINSLGWELNWRDTAPTIDVFEGQNLVEIRKVSNNKFQFLTGNEKGNFTFEISSPFSLNPSKFNFKIGD